MNKIEQMHLDAIESEVYVDESDYDVLFVANTNKAAIKSAEITQEIAVEFAEWIADSKLHGYSKQLYEAMIRHKVSTTKELLQIWKEQKIKTLYYE